VTGGGPSDGTARLQASDRLDVTEAGCSGAALLAAPASSGTPVQDLARARVRPVETLEPDAAAAELYAGRLERYRRLDAAIREFAARP
jgi:sugar (pentulose or hexulose) kinase